MELTIGILLVVAGGALEGLFSLPVTRTPRWQWENIWGLGSLIALLLVPWPVALMTVPDLMGVFEAVPSGILWITILFGLAWGVGGIFWGKAMAAVGIALGVSLLMGLTTVFGSPVQLAIKEPGKLVEPGGLMLLMAVAIMVVGVVVCALAGRNKEKDLTTEPAASTESKPDRTTPFAVGLRFCGISGVLSAGVNFGLVFGEPIGEAARQAGATEGAAPNAIWAVVFTGNYLVNAVYAFYLMFKNKTLGLIFSQGSISYWLWALFMGTAWPLGIVLFGIGAGKMGPYGPFVAFPMLLLTAILFGNLAGALTGEWRGTSSRTKTIMAGGVLVLLVAFALFGRANKMLSDSPPQSVSQGAATSSRSN